MSYRVCVRLRLRLSRKPFDVPFLMPVLLFILTYVSAFASHVEAQSPPAAKHEFRSSWVTTAWGLDWPSGSTPSAQQQSMIDILDQLKSQNMNVIVFQASPRGDAHYDSDRLPWAHTLTGTPGQDPGWDPLRFVINEARKRGMEVHAWFNAFTTAYDSNNDNSGESGIKNVRLTNPDWMEHGGWMNPGIPDARNWQVGNVMELVDRYDIDAIHFDRIRYAGGAYDRDASLMEEHNPDGIVGLDNWRRHNVNEFVRLVYEGIQNIRPSVKIGVTPLGHYDQGSSDGWGAQYAYSDAFQDSRYWAEQGYVDYIAPQIYWTLDDQDAPRFDYIANDWVSNRKNDRHLYIGMGPYKPIIKPELPEQIDAIRDAGAEGMLFYRNDNIVDEHFGGRYPSKSLVPPMPWRSMEETGPVRNFTHEINSQEAVLNWDEPLVDEEHPEQAIRYVIYRTESQESGNGQSVIDTPANMVGLTGETSFIDNPGEADPEDYIWYVTALTRNNVEGDYVTTGEDPPPPEPDDFVISELPYFEDFSGFDLDDENIDDLPEGWGKIGTVQVSDWSDKISANTLRFPSPTDDPIAIIHEIHADIEITKLTLSFDAHFATSGDDGDKIHVGFVSDPDDAGSFTLIETVGLNRESQNYIIALDSYEDGDGRRIGLKAERGGAWNSHYLGNIGIKEKISVDMAITGGAGWRMMSVPVEGVSVSDLAGQNQVQGISGANAFYESEYPEIEFEEGRTVNLMYFDPSEFDGEAEEPTGWMAPADFNAEFTSGQGFIWYFFDNDTGPSVPLNEFTLQADGFEPVRDVVINITDSWNLVGNPFASNLNAAHLSGAGLHSAAAQIWDPDTGSFVTVGFSGDNTIAGWQAFFIERDDGDEFTIPVGVKTEEGADFYKQTPPSDPLVDFTLTGEDEDGHSTTDRAISLVFGEQASHEWDHGDMRKLTPLNTRYATMAFIGERDGKAIRKARESRPIDFEDPIDVPMELRLSGMSGDFELTWEGLSSLPESWGLHLSSHSTGRQIDLQEGGSFEFTAEKGKDYDFTLTISSEPVSGEVPADVPGELALEQNYPNPFNPVTTISYDIPQETAVRLAVYDLLGQQIAVLVDETRAPGCYQVSWDASRVTSGVYLYRLEADGQSLTRHMTLIK